ncbi:MAG: hypothetical protein AAF333_01970 [Planctomycetota bacterium]
MSEAPNNASDPDRPSENESAPEGPTPGSEEKPRRRVPVFRPQRMQQQLWVDALLRGGALGALLIAFVALVGTGTGGSAAGVLGAVVLVIGWAVLNRAGAGVARALPQVSATIDQHPGAGEAVLADLLSRRLLPRWVRLMLYHRLALLRHRQQRYGESAAIAQCLLSADRPGPMGRHRANLLLLLVEARLEMGDTLGAWMALHALAHTPVTLNEALQRMALRARYEVMVGHDDAALHLAEQKVRLAELMPGPQCGAFHALLATAAHRAGRAEDHRRWWTRVELLCSDEQIRQLGEGLGVAIAGVAAPDTAAV